MSQNHLDPSFPIAVTPTTTYTTSNTEAIVGHGSEIALMKSTYPSHDLRIAREHCQKTHGAHDDDHEDKGVL